MHVRKKLALAELLAILGRARRTGESAEDILNAAVDSLLASPNPAARDRATIIYTRYTALLDLPSGSGADSGRAGYSPAGIGEYTQRSASGPSNDDRLTELPRAYHRPRGPYLAPVSAATVLGPTARQIAARELFVIIAAARRRTYASNADRQRAYRARAAAR